MEKQQVTELHHILLYYKLSSDRLTSMASRWEVKPHSCVQLAETKLPTTSPPSWDGWTRSSCQCIWNGGTFLPAGLYQPAARNWFTLKQQLLIWFLNHATFQTHTQSQVSVHLQSKWTSSACNKLHPQNLFGSSSHRGGRDMITWLHGCKSQKRNP